MEELPYTVAFATTTLPMRRQARRRTERRILQQLNPILAVMVRQSAQQVGGDLLYNSLSFVARRLLDYWEQTG